MDKDESNDSGIHLASWSCSCASMPLYYCSVCVLAHINSEEGKQHVVSQLGGADTSRRCSMCKTASHSSDAVTVQAQSRLVSGNRMSLTSDSGDMGEDRDLRAEMLSLRTDINQHMSQVLDGLTVFDDARRRAGPPEQRLRETEQLLDETRQEVESLTHEKIRLQQLTQSPSTGRTDPGQSPALEALLEVLKNKEGECVRMAQEVRELSQLNRSLVTEVSGLSAQLRHSASGSTGVGTTGGLTAEEIAICTAQKVSEVMPILADMKVSSNWLSSQGLEGFLNLTDLAVQDPEKAPSARKVAKVCIRICKLVGHCKAVSGLGRYMRLRLERDMPGCLMLSNYLKKIYQRTCEDPAAKELFREIMGRIQNNIPAFDAAAALIAHFSEALPAASLSHFSKSLLSYLEEPDETTSKWLEYLQQVPVNWAPEIKTAALTSIQSLLYAISEQRFPKACLYLTELLISNKVKSANGLVSFIFNCCEAIKDGNRHVYSLIFKLHGLVESREELIEAAVNAMQLFSSAATIEQVALLMCALDSISEGHYGALAWLYTDWASAGEALGLLGLLLETETLEEATHSCEQLLNSLAASLTATETATCIKFMHRLYRAKTKHRDGLMFSLTSLVRTPIAAFFLKDLAALPEEGASPEMLADTNKLLNLVRKYPDEEILTTAKFLASLIGLLRTEGVKVPMVNKGLKFVLKQRTEHLKRLAAALKPMVKSEPASAQLAVTLLGLLPKVPDETVFLMLFVPDMVMFLASTPMIQPESIISFCSTVLVKCFEVKNYTLLRILKSQQQDNKLGPLTDLIRYSKPPYSITDVYELNLLPNVKADCIQVFDCMRGESLSIVLKQPVKVDTSSSFVFVDNGSIFCCGGED